MTQRTDDFVDLSNEEYLALRAEKNNARRWSQSHVFEGGVPIPRSKALRMIGPTLYAIRLSDGLIKIGWSADLSRRVITLDSRDILAFRQADRVEELPIHQALVQSRARGREYYHPTAEVFAVINEWRERLGMKPLPPLTHL